MLVLMICTSSANSITSQTVSSDAEIRVTETSKISICKLTFTQRIISLLYSVHHFFHCSAMWISSITIRIILSQKEMCVRTALWKCLKIEISELRKIWVYCLFCTAVRVRELQFSVWSVMILLCVKDSLLILIDCFSSSAVNDIIIKQILFVNIETA